MIPVGAQQWLYLQPVDSAFPSYRVQALKEPVYSQKEAEMAAGMGSYTLQQPDSCITDVDMDRSTSDTTNS